MNPFRTGKLVLFQVTYDRDWHFFEIFFFIILGIFGVCLVKVPNYSPAHVLLGSLWSVRRQVQPAGRRLSSKALGQPWGR